MDGQLPGIVIPAYQPEEGLVGLVEELLRDGYPFVVVVNDGSSAASRPVFERLAALPRVEVVTHFVNLGKGEALKTGLNHALVHHADLPGVVTVDADGQHLAADVRSVAQALVCHPDHLCLGVRDFRGRVPWRSRIGNTSSRMMLRLVAGGNLRDTQTGLRGIPRCFMTELLPLRTSGYEFELEMLIRARRRELPVLQIPISTVYRDDNVRSHFNPLWDSLLIYFVFLRFLVSSMLTAVLDIATFTLGYQLGASLLQCSALGRLVAGTFNFLVNKHVVFKARQSYAVEATKYVLLVVSLMLISYQLTLASIERFGLEVLVAKLSVEGFLFLVSFAVQQIYVFASGRERVLAEGRPEPSRAGAEVRCRTRDEPPRTDWDAYYARPGKLARFSRKITARKLLRCLRLYRGSLQEARLLELGGANSCFFDAIIAQLEPAQYAIVDENRSGLDLFQRRHGDDERVRLHAHDILALPEWREKADVCFSVGFIEHFDERRTPEAIQAHFATTRPGGLVVIFFPTPTWLYRATRRIAEAMGMWSFPDERPIELGEVLRQVEPRGRVLYTGINWWIVLTQGMVAVEVGDAQ